MTSATSCVPRPIEERRPEPEAGGEPAADEVGDDAEDLVEEEQRGDLERGVAALVEVEEHEHADRAVRDGVGPVRAGDERVVAQVAGPAGDPPEPSLRESRQYRHRPGDVRAVDQAVGVAPFVVLCRDLRYAEQSRVADGAGGDRPETSA